MNLGTSLQFGIRYLAVLTSASLLWEFAHMPFYTLWQTGTAGHIAFAAIHCTIGDALIGMAALALAVVFAGGAHWPHKRRVRVAVVMILLGLIYTVFSEWLNVELRQSWAYRDIMPTVPPIGTGLTPLLQWIVIPLVAYRYSLGAVRTNVRNRPKTSVES